MHIMNEKNNIRKEYLYKYYNELNSVKRMTNEEYLETLNQLTEEARDLLRFGLINNEYVESYKDEKFDYIRDNRTHLELAFSFLINEIAEVMTKVYFQKNVIRLEYYTQATRDNKGKVNSKADFVMFYKNKLYYAELQTYLFKKNTMTIKKTKFNELAKMAASGKRVFLLNKYMNMGKDVFYELIDFNEIIDKHLYSKADYKIGDKNSISINVQNPLKINSEHTF